MSSKKLYIFTVVMFIFSLLRAAFLGVCAIISIFIDNAIPPVVIMTVYALVLVLIACHYYKCAKYLRNADTFSEKDAHRLFYDNMVLALLYVMIFFACSLVLLYGVVVHRALVILPYFLPWVVISVPYFVHGILWRWKIEKSKKDLVQ